MSKATQYGLTTLIPGPDFRTSVDAEGKWTGSQTFRISSNQAAQALQTFVRKGQSANVLNPEIGTAFDFLFVDTVESQDVPGGITEISVSYVGRSQWSEFADDSESTYSLAASMAEIDIIYHPKVQALDPAELASIVALFHGKAICKNTGNATGPYVVVSNDLAERDMQDIETTDGKLWFRKIFQKGIRTYQAPSFEWTWNASNQGGLPSATIAKLGYIDSSVRGNPPTPPTVDWLMIGATESRTFGGAEATSSFSITWQTSPPGKAWDSDIYEKPA